MGKGGSGKGGGLRAKPAGEGSDRTNLLLLELLAANGHNQERDRQERHQPERTFAKPRPTAENGGWCCKRLAACEWARRGIFNYATNTDCRECGACKTKARTPPAADRLLPASYAKVHGQAAAERALKGPGVSGEGVGAGNLGAGQGKPAGERAQRVVPGLQPRLSKKAKRKLKQQADTSAERPQQAAAAEAKPQEHAKPGEAEAGGSRGAAPERGLDPLVYEEGKDPTHQVAAGVLAKVWANLRKERKPMEGPVAPAATMMQEMVEKKGPAANVEARLKLQASIAKNEQMLVVLGQDGDSDAQELFTTKVVEARKELAKLEGKAPSAQSEAAHLTTVLAQFEQAQQATRDNKSKGVEGALARLAENEGLLDAVVASAQHLKTLLRAAHQANAEAHQAQSKAVEERNQQVVQLMTTRIQKAKEEVAAEGQEHDLSVQALQEHAAAQEAAKQAAQKEAADKLAKLTAHVQQVEKRFLQTFAQARPDCLPKVGPPTTEEGKVDFMALGRLLWQWDSAGAPPFDWEVLKQTLQHHDAITTTKQMAGDELWALWYPEGAPPTNEVIPKQLLKLVCITLDRAAATATFEDQDGATKEADKRASSCMEAIEAAAKRRREGAQLGAN